MPGFGGTDDVLYAVRGMEISQGIWRYSTNTAELRFGIVLPIAAFAHIFGNDVVVLTVGH